MFFSALSLSFVPFSILQLQWFVCTESVLRFLCVIHIIIVRMIFRVLCFSSAFLCFFVWFCGFVSLYFVHHSFFSYSLRLFVRLLVHLYNFIAQIHQDLSIICSVKMLNGEPKTSFYWMILCTRYVLRLIHAHLFISFLVEVFFLRSCCCWCCVSVFLFALPTTILYSYDILF